MANPFYTFADLNVAFTLARSGNVDASLQAIEVAFDGVYAYTQELVAARQGQASVLANLGRYVSTVAPMPADLDGGGYRFKNAADATADTDLVTRRQLYSVAMSAAMPSAADAEGKVISRVDGLVGWHDFLGAPVAINSNQTLAKRKVYHADCSAAPLTLLAPPDPEHGCWFGVRDVKLQAHINNITIDGNGKLTPGGDATYTMNRKGDVVFFVHDSTNGWVRA